MRVTVSLSGTAPLGGTNVTVTGANGTATCVGCLTITPRPVVSGLSPNSLGAGAQLREVVVNGSGFMPGAKLTLSGITVTSTSYIDANTLEALVSVEPDREPLGPQQSW